MQKDYWKNVNSLWNLTSNKPDTAHFVTTDNSAEEEHGNRKVMITSLDRFINILMNSLLQRDKNRDRRRDCYYFKE